VALLLLYSSSQMKRRFFKVVLPLGIVTFIAFLILPGKYTARYALLFNPTSTTVAWRLSAWQLVLDHFSDWFFGGAGMLGFTIYHPDFIGTVATNVPVFGANPHNLILDVFTRTGFGGLLIFAWLISYLLYLGIRISRLRDNTFCVLGTATFIALFTFLVDAMFNRSLLTTRPIWFFAGLILSLWRLWKRNEVGAVGRKLDPQCTKARVASVVRLPREKRRDQSG